MMNQKTTQQIYPELPEWSKRDDLGGLVPSEVRQALRTYADATCEARAAAASKPQAKEARERRRWLSDSFNRGTQTLDEATVSARAMAIALATPVPASIITASVMRDDGGEHPAFCLMVAYRTEKDAMAALAMLTGAPAQAATAKQSPHPEYDKGFSDGWNRCEERQAAASSASIEQEAMQMLWNDQQQEEKEHYRNVARGAERIK